MLTRLLSVIRSLTSEVKLRADKLAQENKPVEELELRSMVELAEAATAMQFSNILGLEINAMLTAANLLEEEGPSRRKLKIRPTDNEPFDIAP